MVATAGAAGGVLAATPAELGLRCVGWPCEALRSLELSGEAFG